MHASVLITMSVYSQCVYSQAKSSASTVDAESSSNAVGESSARPIVSVLARWADKKYYAGRLKEARPNNKFVVVFEDGATKTLGPDVIVFGLVGGQLPVLDQYVHARIDGGDTYEPGLVTHISADGPDRAAIRYTVVAESQTVTVTASDIYLEEEQAKAIQKVTDANVAIATAAVSSAVVGEDSLLLKSPSTPSSTKRSSRPTSKFGEATSSATASSRSRAPAATKAADSAAEPSTSASAVAAASGSGARQTAAKRNKRYS